MYTFVRSLLIIFILTSIIHSLTLAQGENNPPPLRRVTLYKHGVGYFERQGKVNGDQQVTFLFDAAQMNDVLKSLVALDLGKGADKGKISAVTFDSIKPVDKRLEEFGISLDSTNAMGLTSLLGQLKGARVEVRAGPTPAAGVGPAAGVVVGIEKRARTQGVEKIKTQELVLVSEGGELRSIPLDQIRGIKLLDAKLREDLDQYLSILQSTIHKNLRKLTISTTGQGERDLFLSYVVEAPIWKTTYRVVLDAKSKPFLQGWVLVDNVQDEDWNEVTLSLVSGAPVSFIQDLQQPRYKQRPVVGMPDDVTVAPQIPQASLGTTLGFASGGAAIEGVVKDMTGAALPSATVKATQTSNGAEITATTDANGRYRLRGLPPGTYNLRVESPGFKSYMIERLRLASGTLARNDIQMDVASVSETVSVSASSVKSLPLNGRNYLNMARLAPGAAAMRDDDSGVEADVETQDIGELFEYRISHPVTIKRNSSALIPILQNQIEGESVSLYNQEAREQNPMSALYLNNTTGLTLESGPLTIIENDTYAGEALTGRIKPGEKRFITYAVDLGCRVSVKEDEEDQKAYRAEIVNGEFRLYYKQMKTTVYTLNNLTDRAKTVYVEHPYDKDEKWQLVKTARPVETTEEYHRFKVSVAPKTTTQFSVNEELPESHTYALTNITTNEIQVFVKSNYLTPEMKQSLEGVTELKTQIAATSREIANKQGEITAITRDQERMRENLRALGKTEEEKQLVQRYVGKIAQGEDQLERLRQEEKKLQDQRNNLQRQLDERVKKLAMDHRLN
ncbi:MAG TPA: carboxypeptidase regulatory-like domain-containing protein [Blastocatellia bacterium]|nr:carboxypeptidase regulatory-like domain-containing protein [Blastocatellia bacterium]